MTEFLIKLTFIDFYYNPVCIIFKIFSFSVPLITECDHIIYILSMFCVRVYLHAVGCGTLKHFNMGTIPIPILCTAERMDKGLKLTLCCYLRIKKLKGS